MKIRVLFDRLVTADGNAETMYSAGKNGANQNVRVIRVRKDE